MQAEPAAGPSPSGGVRPFLGAPGLLGLLGVAAAVRAIAWSRTTVMFNDGPVFLALAEAVGEGRWAEVLAHPYHPLYPVAIAGVSSLGIGAETAAIVVSIAGGLLAIGALHDFLGRAFGPVLAGLGAWTLALHPWAVDFTADVMSDGLYMGLYLAAFAALWRAQESGRVAPAAACGVLGALAYGVRPEGAGILLVAAAWLAARLWLERDARRARAAALAALALTATLLMAPYVTILSLDAGTLRLTQKKSVAGLLEGQDRSASARATERRLLSDAAPPGIWLPQSAVPARGATRPPERSLAGAGATVLRVVRTSAAALRYEVLLFVVLGCLWLATLPPRPGRSALLWTPPLLYSGLLLMLVWGTGYVSRRHALTPWLPLLGVAALGWQGSLTWLRERVRRGTGDPGRDPGQVGSGVSPRAIALALVIVLTLAWGARDLRPRRLDREAVRQAAVWLAEHEPGSAGVAAQKLRTAYYAGARYVPLPSGTDGRLEAWLRGGAARWIVIDGTRLDDHVGLREGIGDWLTERHSIEAAGRKALVLEILPEPAH